MRRDRTLRAKVREAGLEPGMVPWYPSDLPEEDAEGKESSSDEDVVLAKTMKKKRGRKQKVPLEDQESNEVTTDEGTQVSSHLSRMEINEIVGVVEPVTSTSGMTAKRDFNCQLLDSSHADHRDIDRLQRHLLSEYIHAWNCHDASS